jgi:asparagine synthase (glutamine-hydrolysing)
MAEQLLMRVDKLSMAHSIEVRAPFLNRHLAQYAISLPSTIRALDGRPKGLLRRAVMDLLPPATFARSKMGFSTPAENWFRGGFGDRLRNLARRAELLTSGVLSTAEVARLLAEHQSGRRRHHPKLWNLLCLLEWYEHAGVTSISDTTEPRQMVSA